MNIHINVGLLLLPNGKKIGRKTKRFLKSFPQIQRKVQDIIRTFIEKFSKLNDVTKRDLAGGLSLTFSNRVPDPESLQKFEQFFGEIKQLNFHKYIEEVKAAILNFDLPLSKRNKLGQELSTWMLSSLETWNSFTENLILSMINKEHKNKLSLTSGIFNFSTFKIPNNDIKILKNSKNTVLKLKVPLKRLKRRIKSECLDYAAKFRKYVEKNKHQISSDNSSFKSWLIEAANSSKSQDFKLFYLKLLKTTYSGL